MSENSGNEIKFFVVLKRALFNTRSEIRRISSVSDSEMVAVVEKHAFNELMDELAALYAEHNEVCKENVKLKAENERLKQQSLGTQLVTAIAGIPYVPSNELELAMLKAENEALRAKSKLLHGCPACGEEWTNLDEMLDIEKERDNYRKYADQLARACEVAKKYLEPELVEPGRTVFWGLVKALAEYAKFREGK